MSLKQQSISTASATLALLLISQSACNDHTATAEDRGNLINIRPGYGTEEVYVGMRINELDKTYGSPLKLSGVPRDILQEFHNYDKGIKVVSFEDRILKITYYLQPSEDDAGTYSAFPGAVRGTLVQGSSINAIIEVLGIPQERTATSSTTYLEYLNEGVTFRCGSEGLKSVIAEDPNFDMDKVYLKIEEARKAAK